MATGEDPGGAVERLIQAGLGVLLVLVVAAAAGCGAQTSPGRDDVADPAEKVEDEGGVPDGTVSHRVIADEHIGTGRPHQHVAVVATDRDALEQWWESFGMPGPVPAVDFGAGEEVVLVGTGEPSNCNLDLTDLVREGDRLVLQLEHSGGREICTADWVPRVIVLGVTGQALGEEPVLIVPGEGSHPALRIDDEL